MVRRQDHQRLSDVKYYYKHLLLDRRGLLRNSIGE